MVPSFVSRIPAPGATEIHTSPGRMLSSTWPPTTQVFETRYDAASFAIFFATFLMGLVCADGLILWTEHLVSPFLPKGWAFLVSKGVSIVGPFFLMYFVRKYAFQKLESKRKGS